MTGDGQEEAVVQTACGNAMWNWGIDEFFIYAMRNGQPVLLEHSDLFKMGRDYLRYYPDGSLWGMVHSENSVRIHRGLLAVDWNADGPHCCPKYIATLEYRWNNGQLMLTGRPGRRPWRSNG